MEGKINGIPYEQKVLATQAHIDIETTLDYGGGVFFGPEIEDSESQPWRTHYFQHERKLCVNWQLVGAETKLIYNSPFLSWPAADKTRSVESLHCAALQAGDCGIAHFNVGQSGYGYLENESLGRHVLAFAP